MFLPSRASVNCGLTIASFLQIGLRTRVSLRATDSFETKGESAYAHGMSDEVITDTAGEVAVLRMNRPERRNAMDTKMLERLVEALDQLLGSDAAALVITGSGGAFSAGADISEEVDPEGAVRRMELFCLLYEKASRFTKPTVAAIDGHCIGGGAELASACDLRVGTPSARIRFPGAAFGIPVGSARLPALIGVSRAKDLLMTSRTMHGKEAYEFGFLNRLVEPDAMEPSAIELASSMTANKGATGQKTIIGEMYGFSEKLSTENRLLVRWQSQAQGLMGDEGSKK